MKAAAPQDRFDLRLVAPAIAAWVVAWQVSTLPPRPVLVLAGAALLLSALTVRKSAVLAAVLLCAAAAAASTALRVEARSQGPLPDLARQQAAVVVEAVLTADPRLSATRRPGRAPTVLIEVRVERLTSRGEVTRVRTPVLVFASDDSWLGLLPSQRVRIEGLLRPVEAGEEVAALLSARGPPVVLSDPSRVQRVAGFLRAGLREAAAPLPDAAGGLLPGLVVGDTSQLDPEVRADMRAVGLTHLTAVSGTNVAIVLAAVLALARVSGFGVRSAPVVAGLGLIGFVVLARPSPSVLRAGAMGVIALLALATGGRRRAIPALAASVLVLVLLAPDLAGDAGFALSVLATGGLLVLGPALRQKFARWLPGWTADALAVPVAAQLACGPVLVAISGELSLLSVPANLLAAAAVPPATVLGVVAALVAPVCLPLAQLVCWLAWLPTAWLVLIARVGADLPGGMLPWPSGQRGALLLVALTVLAVAVLTRPRLRRLASALALSVALTLAVLRVALPGWPPAGWVLVMCDVGQGDATVARTGPSSAVLIDVGPDPDLIDGCLDRLGVHVVPLVVLSHPHADHVDGLPGVLRDRAVAAVQVGMGDDPPEQVAKVASWVAAAGLPLLQGAAGQRRRAGQIWWDVLGPTRSFDQPNNASLVLKLHTHGITVLLPGDVEPEAQQGLLAAGVDLSADILKTPHHGSANQNPAFLAAVGARVVLTGVGEHNDYGHPSAQTLGLLTSGGALSFRTDRDGDIAVLVRDGQLSVLPRSG